MEAISSLRSKPLASFAAVARTGSLQSVRSLTAFAVKSERVRYRTRLGVPLVLKFYSPFALCTFQAAQPPTHFPAMALPQKESSPIFSDATAGTLRLIAYLALAAILMVLDHRNGWLHRVRYLSAAAIVPIYKIAAAPADWVHEASTAFAQRSALIDENRQLRETLMLAEARLNRMDAVAHQNERLKQLLDTQHLLGMHAQLARRIDVQLGPTRDHVMLNVGADEGVHVGQVVIDSHGVMGQIIETLPHASVAMLVVDPDHAVPVMLARNGLRGIAHGTGDPDQLVVPNLPLSSDIKPGDQWVTSGLGGR